MPPTAAAECLWWAWPYFVGVAGSFTDDFPVTEDFLELDSMVQDCIDEITQDLGFYVILKNPLLTWPPPPFEGRPLLMTLMHYHLHCKRIVIQKQSTTFTVK